MKRIDEPNRRLFLLTNVMGAATAFSLFGDLALFASLPTHFASVGITLASLGIVLGIHRLIRIPGNALGGMLIQSRPRRPFFLGGMLLAFFSTLGYGFVQGLAWLLVMRVIWGLAWILILISGMTMLIDATTPENRARWMGLANTWYVLGFAGGSLSGGLVADLAGFQNAMFVCAAFTFAGLLLALFALPETKPAYQQQTTSTTALAPRSLRNARQLINGIPGLWVILFTFMVNQFISEGVLLSMLSHLLNVRFGNAYSLGLLVIGAASLGGILNVLRAVITALAGPLVGLWSDKHDPARLVTFTVGLVTSLVSLLMIGLGRSLWWIVPGALINAVGYTMLRLASSVYIGDRSTPANQTRLVGIYATFGDIGSAAGPLFGYWLITFSSLDGVFLVSALLYTLCLPFLMRLAKINQPKTEPIPS